MVDLEIRPDCVVVTREREHPNVAIIPAQVEGVEVLDFVGKKNPHRGWYSLDGIQPSHDIVYRSFKHLPVHFETVVQPLPAGDGMPMKVTSIPAECESGKDVAAIVCGEDLILVSYNGPAKIKCRDVNFEGSVLFLQYGSNGKGSQAHMVDGRALSIGDKKLFSTDTPPIAFSLDVR
jgi:hypothetical protein